MSWINDAVVRLNKIIAIIGNVPGVNYVVAGSVKLGGQLAAHLTSTLSTGAAITSLPVTGLANTIPSGAVVTLTSADTLHTQTWTTTAQVASGAASIPVTSQTPNYAYTTAAVINAPVTGDFTMSGPVALPTPGTFTATVDLPS
jgi:hypothetical protein